MLSPSGVGYVELRMNGRTILVFAMVSTVSALRSIDELRGMFESAFGPGKGELRMACAPGRANIIGEHTDYQEGFVAPFALKERCYIVYRQRNDAILRAFASELQEWAEIDLSQMAKQRQANQVWGSRTQDWTDMTWLRYVAGPMEWMRTEALVKGEKEYRGCDALITSTVPMGGGVSSSSALAVASAVAARDIYRDLSWTSTYNMLKACCESEWHYSGVRGGIMDQFASLNGKDGEAFVLDCRTKKIAHWLAFPASLSFVIINTNVKHSLVDSPYAQRRQACERVAAKAKVSHLRDLSDMNDNDKALQILQSLDLDATDLKRATHGVLENNRVLQAVDAAQREDWITFGKLLNQAHDSLAKLYEVSCPELDAACQAAIESPHCLGARMMGGGFGGCAIALCNGDPAALAQYIAPRFTELTNGNVATIFTAFPGPGAQLLSSDASTWTPVYDIAFYQDNI
mmetsp:Transcript_21854/g.28316  ORF Transcript_21854/g.28316 Transcript_21854/m.28316 type:complete len:460 (+) Transcript_21854:26-1405(+)